MTLLRRRLTAPCRITSIIVSLLLALCASAVQAAISATIAGPPVALWEPVDESSIRPAEARVLIPARHLTVRLPIFQLRSSIVVPTENLMVIRISLFVIAALLIGAHFLRAGNVPLVALCLAMPLLLLHRKRWILILIQLSAYCAAAGWLWVAYRLVESRQHIGQPWSAAAIILGAVALFTLVAGLLMNSQRMRERYPV